MPDTYIAIMLQSLKKKEQVLDEIIRLDDRQKDTLTDPECPFDVFDETVEAYRLSIMRPHFWLLQMHPWAERLPLIHRLQRI